MPQAQRTIDLEEFVSLDEIDPVFYDSAYYLVPEKAAVKPYALLTTAMDRSEKVGIGRFVMRSKEYVAALRPSDGKLVLSTMVYADELNDVDEFPEIEAAAVGQALRQGDRHGHPAGRVARRPTSSPRSTTTPTASSSST